MNPNDLYVNHIASLVASIETAICALKGTEEFDDLPEHLRIPAALIELRDALTNANAFAEMDIDLLALIDLSESD